MYLNCHSYYSLRYGTLSIRRLVEEGLRCGVSALALTDINATTGVFDFVRACLEARIKPLIGIEFRSGERLLFIALAKDHHGFYEMNKWLSQHHIAKKALPGRAPRFDQVIVIYPSHNAPQALRPNEYIGIRIRELLRLGRSPVKELSHRFTILHPVTISSKKEHTLHRLLRAVDNNVLASKLRPEQCAGPDEYMLPIAELLHHYRHYPKLAENTQHIIRSCNFEFDFEQPKNKQTYTGSRYSDRLLLNDLAMEGLERRYGKQHREAKARTLRELEIIDRLNFSAYFLITWDIIRYSISRGFYHVGRGSGANSIVSYLLRITDVCPLELNLYFERFLNPSRTSPPDFDIDWSWKDRDSILNYTFKRFGTECTAFVGTIGMFKHRSIMRELGKTLGLPKEELDELSANRKEQHPNHYIVKAIHRYGKMLTEFPNMRSLHSCGILISEKPISYYTALEMPPKGFQTAQIDMYICEDIGFEKLDILSQRGIGHINDTIQLVKANRGVEVDIHNLQRVKDNPASNAQLSCGHTIGCFYIESPAMRGLLRRLKCDSYKVLVAASSVIRPGVAKSGMLREYVFRHNNPEGFEYHHPVFEEQLGETYGIMVYQEDVMKIAHHFAGLDLSDADILRRAMSGKKRLRRKMEEIKSKFFRNCKAKGYPDELSQEVYRQIESFAGYSFCKAHSASYSVESYQSLYLKVKYPLEFMVAVINNFGGFYRTEVYVHEARMAGGIIHNPCVNRGEYLTILYGKDIYIGFIHIHGLPKAIAEDIAAERRRRGEYTSLEDFVTRSGIGIESLQNLIFVGAFRFLNKPKNELILEARMLFGKSKPIRQARLFSTPPKRFKLPQLIRSSFEDAFDEIELLGFMTQTSPFDLLETKFRGDIFVKDLSKYKNQSVRIVGYLICIKDVPTARGHMHFGTWIDAKGDYFDTTHFPPCLQQYPFSGAGCYLIKGKIVIDFHFPSIEVEKMAKLPMVPDPRYSDDEFKRPARLPTASDNNPGLLTRKPYPSKEEVEKKYGR